MKKSIMCWALAVAAVAVAAAQESAGTAPRVALDTTHGRIVLELDAAAAPRTVASFLERVADGFYDGTVFHRVIPGFMIQGGGFTADLEFKEPGFTLPNEADNGRSNVRGAVAMARRPDPHSASTQFFINLVDNPGLDHTAKTQQGWGYTVFGRVVEGMEVADRIAMVATATRGPMGNVPVEPVIVTRAARLP